MNWQKEELGDYISCKSSNISSNYSDIKDARTEPSVHEKADFKGGIFLHTNENLHILGALNYWFEMLWILKKFPNNTNKKNNSKLCWYEMWSFPWNRIKDDSYISDRRINQLKLQFERVEAAIHVLQREMNWPQSKDWPKQIKN